MTRADAIRIILRGMNLDTAGGVTVPATTTEASGPGPKVPQPVPAKTRDQRAG
jgi:hypothetical protein